MALPLELPIPIKRTTAGPLDYLYGPYTTAQEACTAIPLPLRSDGLTVLISGVGEYWWQIADLSNNGLVRKINTVKSELEEFPTFSAFPPVGLSDTIYIALDTLKQYIWSGSTYNALSDLGISINQRAAIINANNPSATNPFLTVSQLPAPIDNSSFAKINTENTFSSKQTFGNSNTNTSLDSNSIDFKDGANINSIQSLGNNLQVISGHFKVPIPLQDTDAATKKYVDDSINAIPISNSKSVEIATFYNANELTNTVSFLLAENAPKTISRYKIILLKKDATSGNVVESNYGDSSMNSNEYTNFYRENY